MKALILLVLMEPRLAMLSCRQLPQFGYCTSCYREKANWILTITRHVAGARKKVCRSSPYLKLNGMRLKLSSLNSLRGARFTFYTPFSIFPLLFQQFDLAIFFVLLPSLMLLRSLPSSFSSTVACSAFFDDMLDTRTWPIIIISPQPPTSTSSPMRVFAFDSNCERQRKRRPFE